MKIEHLPRTTRKILRYIKRRSGNNTPEAIEKRFGNDALARVAYLESIGFISTGEYEARNGKPYSYNRRITGKGVDFLDNWNDRRYERKIEIIVVPLMSSALGGFIVWLLTAFVSVQKSLPTQP